MANSQNMYCCNQSKFEKHYFIENGVLSANLVNHYQYYKTKKKKRELLKFIVTCSFYNMPVLFHIYK